VQKRTKIALERYHLRRTQDREFNGPFHEEWSNDAFIRKM
jgi:hypothetical protein